MVHQNHVELSQNVATFDLLWSKVGILVFSELIASLNVRVERLSCPWNSDTTRHE